MHNVILIEHLKSVNQLFEDKECLFFCYHFIFTKYTLESAAITVFINKIEVVGGFKHIDILDDMLIFLDIC